jgi:hypothetical protein
MRRMAAQWREMPDEERSEWNAKAVEDKQRYADELATYNGPLKIPNKRAQAALALAQPVSRARRRRRCVVSMMMSHTTPYMREASVVHPRARLCITTVVHLRVCGRLSGGAIAGAAWLTGVRLLLCRRRRCPAAAAMSSRHKTGPPPPRPPASPPPARPSAPRRTRARPRGP